MLQHKYMIKKRKRVAEITPSAIVLRSRGSIRVDICLGKQVVEIGTGNRQVGGGLPGRLSGGISRYAREEPDSARRPAQRDRFNRRTA